MHYNRPHNTTQTIHKLIAHLKSSSVLFFVSSLFSDYIFLLHCPLVFNLKRFFNAWTGIYEPIFLCFLLFFFLDFNHLNFQLFHNFRLLSHKSEYWIDNINSEYWIDENQSCFFCVSLIHFDFWGCYRCTLPFCKWINTTDRCIFGEHKAVYLFICTLNIRERDEMYPNYMKIGENVKIRGSHVTFPYSFICFFRKKNITIGLINKKYNYEQWTCNIRNLKWEFSLDFTVGFNFQLFFRCNINFSVTIHQNRNYLMCV